MIRRDLLHQLLKERQDGSFLYPAYGSQSIAEVPQSILAHFGAPTGRPTLPFPLAPEGAQRVLLFFVDGLGFDAFTSFARYLPFFMRLRDRAVTFPLTSVFPSTTPAALTTFHTGLTPEEHGLPEWTVYFEELETIVETLPFRAHLTPGRDTLLQSRGTPQMLYEGTTVYRQLAEAGIPSYNFTSAEYDRSSYTQMTQDGSTIVPFTDAVDLFAQLVRFIKGTPGPWYAFVNWAEVDSAEHAYGPGTPEHRDAARRLSDHFEEKLLAQLAPEEAAGAAILLSSDHGQSAIRDEEIIYLNEYIDLEESYERTSGGLPIYPTGAPHDVFLHVEESQVPRICAYLREKLAGRADILSTDEALRRGLFGFARASARFTRRIGNILILPYEGYHVWYRHMPELYFGQKGIHGGLARAEMLVPLVTAPLAALLG